MSPEGIFAICFECVFPGNLVILPGTASMLVNKGGDNYKRSIVNYCFTIYQNL